MIFEGLSIKQITQFFLERESPTLRISSLSTISKENMPFALGTLLIDFILG